MIYVFIILGVVIVQGVIGFLLYRDAAKLRMDGAGIWFFGTMFLGVLAILVYVWSRSRHKKQAELFEQLYRTA